MTRSGDARRASDVTDGRRGGGGRGFPETGEGREGARSHDVIQVRRAEGGRTSRDVV